MSSIFRHIPKSKKSLDDSEEIESEDPTSIFNFSRKSEKRKNEQKIESQVNPRYTSEQEEGFRYLMQLGAGRDEARLYTNPVTAIPVIGTDIANVFGANLPNLGSEITNAIGGLTGIDPKPQNEEEQVARVVGALSSISPYDLLEMAKQLPDLASYLSKLPKQVWEKLFSKGTKEATKTIPESTQIAQKHGLRTFAGLENEKPPKNPIVSPEKQKRLGEELSETSEQAVNKILDNKLPAREARKQGVDLKESFNSSLAKAEEAASKVNEVNIDPVIEYIDNEIGRIKKSAPSLSNKDAVKLRILETEKRKLTTKNPEKPSFDYITGKTSIPPRRISKKVNGKQSIDQYRNFNENVENIYRKSEFSGSENAAKNTYEGIKKEWIKSIEKADETAGKELTNSNRIYHETSNMEHVDRIMERAFKDGYSPKKLETILHQKGNGKFLERYLGKEAVNDLKDIAKYGKMAEKRIISKLKNPKTLMQYAAHLTPLKAMLLLGKHAGTFGLIGAYKMTKGIVNRVQGAMFTSPKVSKAYSNFVETAATGDLKQFEKASALLSAAFTEEFNSEEKFLSSFE